MVQNTLKAAEPQGPEHRPPPEQRLRGQQPGGTGQQGAVTHPGPLPLTRQAAGPRTTAQHQGQRRGHHVDHPPAGRLGHHPGHRPGQQDAEQQAAHDHAHDVAPVGTSSARDAAIGIRSCCRHRPCTPTTTATPISTPMSGAAAEASRPPAVTTSTVGTSHRRVSRSPERDQEGQAEGVADHRAKVTTRPAVPELVPKDLARVSSSGWA